MIQYPVHIQTFLHMLYSEERRTYHGMNHIKYLLAKAEEWYLDNVYEWQTYVLLQHAIWWHDSVYSVFGKPGRNEDNSAALFTGTQTNEFRIDAGMDEDEAGGIIHMAILNTARHLEDIDFDKEYAGSRLTANVSMLMLDLDLAGFAEELDMVKFHSELVLQEYAPLGKSREQLLEGRISFLHALLKRKRIFYTDYFFKKCETKARFNIMDSIEATQEELKEIRKELTPEPNPYPYSDWAIPGRVYKRFVNHAGLRGRVAQNSLIDWQLRFDDGTVWYVRDIDNLTIEEDVVNYK